MPAKLHQSHATGSRDIQKGWILSGQASYNRAGKQFPPYVYLETLYSVIFIKIPAVMDMSSCRFVDKVEYFGAICLP